MSNDSLQEPLLPSRRVEYMNRLGQIAQQVGERVLTMKRQEIANTIQVSGHWYSTVDDAARMTLRELTTRLLPGVSLLEESDIPRGGLHHHDTQYPLLVGDAVEGSANATCGLASPFVLYARRPILAGTALMLLEREILDSIVATAFYDWSSQVLYSTVRAEHGAFFPFINQRIVLREETMEFVRLAQTFAIVPGYSHTNVHDRALVEEALLKIGIRTMGGSRSSAQDLLDLVWGRAVAYVDLRQLFRDSTQDRDEVLRAWDVGALLPFLDGLGFRITVEHGKKSWQECHFGESLALIITCDGQIWRKVKDAICQLPFFDVGISEIVSVKIPPPPITPGISEA